MELKELALNVSEYISQDMEQKSLLMLALEKKSKTVVKILNGDVASLAYLFKCLFHEGGIRMSSDLLTGILTAAHIELPEYVIRGAICSAEVFATDFKRSRYKDKG